MGGACGEIFQTRLLLHLLWVSEEFRNQGYGRQLLRSAEGMAHDDRFIGPSLGGRLLQQLSLGFWRFCASLQNTSVAIRPIRPTQTGPVNTDHAVRIRKLVHQTEREIAQATTCAMNEYNISALPLDAHVNFDTIHVYELPGWGIMFAGMCLASCRKDLDKRDNANCDQEN